MFQKYNGILRGVGSRQVESEREGRGQVPFDKIEKALGNMYTTTLHVINSAIIKLSKLTVADKVYRGISSRVLPKSMKVKDEYSVRGGVEFGFMSCSRERGEAMKYARGASTTGDGRTPPAILIEMQMGMIDRGADFSWLSQYPHEREVLFAPLTGIEIVNTAIDNDVLVVSVRPSVNLNSLVIEDVIAKMQRSHMQLVELLTSDLRFAGVPADALMPLTMLKVEVDLSDASMFNSTHYYREATNRALERQGQVFSLLADEHSLSSQMDMSMLKRTALIAAQAGKHDLAIRILLRAQKAAGGRHVATGKPELSDGGKGASAGAQLKQYRERLDALTCPDGTSEESLDLFAVAKSLCYDGLQQPWPATLVSLGMRAAHTDESKAGGGHSSSSSTATELRLPLDLLATLFAALAERDDPFAVDSEVLMFDVKARGRSGSSLFDGGVKARYPPEGGAGVTFDIQKRDDSLAKGVPEQSVVAEDHASGIGAALRVAASLGEADIVASLVQAKASVYRCDAQANTAMIIAAEAGHSDVCRVLIEHSPGLMELGDFRNRQRQSAYDLAVGNRRVAVLRLLRPQESDKAIDRAKYDSFVAEVQRRYEADPHNKPDWEETFPGGKLGELDVAKRPDEGFTLLMVACRAPRSEAMLSLIEHILADETTADVNAESKSHCTALTICAEEGRADLIKMLLAKGADATWEYSPPKDGATGTSPLSWAVVFGHADCCRLLIDAKANIDLERHKNGKTKNAEGKEVPDPTVNKDKRTLLMLASMSGHAEIATLLLDEKRKESEEAMLNYLNRHNFAVESALTFCVRYGLSEVAKVLLDRGISFEHELVKPYWTSLHRSAGNGHESTVRQLLRAVETRFGHETAQRLLDHKGNGITALHAAANSDYAGMVQLLIEKGADPTLADADGATPLFATARLGQTGAMRVLLKDQHASARNSTGGLNTMAVVAKATEERPYPLKRTPLMAACQMEIEDSVRPLLKAPGIDLSCTECDGHGDGGDDALAIVVRTKNETLLRLLLSARAPGNLERALSIASAQFQKYKEEEEALQQGSQAASAARGPPGAVLRSSADPWGGSMMSVITSTGGATARYSPESPIGQALIMQRLLEQKMQAVQIKQQRKSERELALRRQASKVVKQQDQLVVDPDIHLLFDASSPLALTFKKQYSGQLVPPRPTAQDLQNRSTKTGRVHVFNGIVTQIGPYGGIFLRVGCSPIEDWMLMWRTLMKYVTMLVQREADRDRKYWVRDCTAPMEHAWHARDAQATVHPSRTPAPHPPPTHPPHTLRMSLTPSPCLPLTPPPHSSPSLRRGAPRSARTARRASPST